MKSTRLFYLSYVVLPAVMLAYAYYLQFVEGLAPCPLCIFQRLAYLAIAVVALVGVIHAPKNYFLRIYSGLIVIFAAVGAVIAGRQVWLQHLPADKVPECGPGLDYMLDVFPLSDTLRMVFTGSGECAKVDWTFLSFSVAEWSLLCFLIFLTVAALHFFRAKQG